DGARQESKAADKHGQEAGLKLLQLNSEIENLRKDQLGFEYQQGFKDGVTKWIDQTRVLVAKIGDTHGTDTARIHQVEEALNQIDLEAQRLVGQPSSTRERAQVVQSEISDLTGKLSKTLDLLVESRVQLEVNNFKIASLEENLRELESQLSLGVEELEPLQVQATQLGLRFEQPRELQIISIDLATIEERLKPLTHLSEEVEKMYRNYAGLYEDLRKKAEVVEHNRGEVLQELRGRLEKWRAIMEKLFEELSTRYDSLLSEVGAKGRIVLRPAREIEKSGLELYAGFKGNEPVSLDSLAPSGGERTVAIVAFLLSLQQYVESPFRAIDEFDVHMDPKNRETVTKLIYAAATSGDPNEYIAITPGEVALPEQGDVHVVVVQNVEGTSIVRELK
ncbi:MAG TPA: hypothetical protein VE177_06730, partial [Candidatus Binatus sp.]|nr:hypothetical protein [Candidatus Binatus sp.]